MHHSSVCLSRCFSSHCQVAIHHQALQNYIFLSKPAMSTLLDSFISHRYLTSLIPAQTMSILTSTPLTAASAYCSLHALRLFNIGFFLSCSLLFFVLLHSLWPAMPPKMVALKALELSLFPIHFFHSFLFYTDAVSTCCVMLLCVCVVKRKMAAAGLVSAFFALLFLLCTETTIARNE